LDYGNGRIGAGRVFLIEARFAHGRDHRLHVWTCPDCNGRGASTVPAKGS
jgi:hypothetical protein